MQTVEKYTDVIAHAATETATTQKNYEAVRFNAMKHGILSKQVVLAHEDKAEFSELLERLIEEHQPAGITEMHLIEELAGIIWRKRRVLTAEGANINRNLHSIIHNKYRSPIPASAPFEHNLLHQNTDLIDLLKTRPEDIPKYLQEARQELDAARKAESILRKGSINAYKKALRALTPEHYDFWQDYVDNDEYPNTPDGLMQFFRAILIPLCMRTEYEIQYTLAIKAQTIGEGLQPERLESLTRYETHLDRKFERTLAMLLKMREMRGTK